jgi:hypothetical protein
VTGAHRLVLGGLLAAALAAGGCGPVVYVSEVTRQTQRSLTDARIAGAERLAPYEYAAALEYLEKARELGGAARYEDARELARLARALADKATLLSKARAK